MNQKSIVYIGNNNPKKFKRGVENVIYTQAMTAPFEFKYYLFFDTENQLFRWGDLICIGIEKGWRKYCVLNLVLFKLYTKHRTLFIHSHGPVKTVFILKKTDLLTVHDAIYYQRKGLKQKIYPMFYLIEKIAYWKSKKIHFISRYAQSQSLLSSKQLSQKSIIIYNTSFLEQILLNYSDVRNENSHVLRLFAVRGIQVRTRIDLLLDFAEYVQTFLIDGKRIFIEVAGKGELLDYYKREISRRNLNNIKLLGFVPDEEIVEKYVKSDIVIMPCEHAEGFGLPIIEGYLFDKPVIASNKCAVPEIIYSSDYLFENTPDSIWRTLNRIVAEKKDFYSFYKDNYSYSRYSMQMKNLYIALNRKK